MGADSEEIEAESSESSESAPASTREALERMFDEPPAAANTDGTPAEVQAKPKADSEETAAKTSQEARDEKGRFVPKAKGEAEPPPKQQAQPDPKAPVKADAEVKPPPAESAKGPQAWKPGAREKWASLPPEVQQEVLRVERETRQALREAAPARQGWETFQQVVNPHAAMIQQDFGGNPFAAVDNLLQTAVALRNAPPEHKAQLIASIIQRFGVSVPLLDRAITGQPLPPGQAPTLDPSVLEAQIYQKIMANIAEQRTSAMTAKYEGELDDFAQSHEFFEDVRENMATLIEAGIAKDWPDAYDKAVSLTPDISGVLQQREAAKQAANAQASTQRARLASSSVKSTPAGKPPPRAEAMSTREALEARWDELTG